MSDYSARARDAFLTVTANPTQRVLVMDQKRPIILRHKASGEFYRRMVLGSDTRTANAASARGWASHDAAWRFSRKFGDRYEVVDTREDAV